MKKLGLLAVLMILFAACTEEEVHITMNTHVIIGKWNVKDKVGGFTTDCERTEYILFNADSTIFRQQCGQTSGIWYIENEKLVLDLVLDTVFTDATYSCELLSEREIKIKCVEKPYIWATYTKEY